MRLFTSIAVILSLALISGASTAQQSPSQAQAEGLSLGSASLQNGRLTPSESNKTAQTSGTSNVWGGSYSGNPDTALTTKQNEPSMIGIGNKAINESVSSFGGYNKNRDDQASQATYFLNRNPVLKPSIAPDDSMIKGAHSGIGEDIFISSKEKECKQVTVTTPLDPNELYSCLETYSPYVVPCNSDSNVSFVSVAAPDIAAGISSYSCPPGQSINGTMCNGTETSSTPAVSTASCPGGGILSGSSCLTYSSYAASPVSTCPAGTQDNGTSCSSFNYLPFATTEGCRTDQVPAEISPLILKGVVINNGAKLCRVPTYESNCNSIIARTSMPFIISTDVWNGQPRYCYFQTVSVPICPSGGTFNGSACEVITNVAPTVSGYTCPSGGVLSGQTCQVNGTVPAVFTNSCPNGGTLSGSTCYTVTNTTTPANPNYYCPQGYYLNKSTCTGKRIDEMKSSEISGCGALEALAQ